MSSSICATTASPTSSSTDASPPPGAAAAAGIAYFWRLELDPLLLVTHALDGDSYRETARFTERVVIGEPVELTFRLADPVV